MRILILGILIIEWVIAPISGLQCFFCLSDHRMPRDDCIKVNDSTRSIFCDSNVYECVVYLRRDRATRNHTGEIVRDCMVDSSLLIAGEFETCSGGDKCNGFNFPRDRLLCQQCEDCDQIAREPELCRRYFKYHMACIAYINSESNQIKRGCQTDHGDTLCDLGHAKCVYCTSDDCNRDPRARKIALQCHHCDEGDRDCFVVQDHTASVKYAFSVRMGEAFYCWTIFAGVNNGVVFRFHEFHPKFKRYFGRFCGLKRQPSPQCPRCFGHLCNSHVKDVRCFECQEGDPDCDNTGLSLSPVQCRVNYVRNIGCFGLVMGESSLAAGIRRGCITDMDYLHQKSCIESRTCFFCRGDSCNQGMILCYVCSGSGGTTKRIAADPHANVTLPSCLHVSKDEWATEYCASGDSCFLHMESAAAYDGPIAVERGCMSRNHFLYPAKELASPGTFQLCNTHLCNDWDALQVNHSCYNVHNDQTKCLSTANHCFTVHFMDSMGEDRFEKGCYYPSNKFNSDQVVCDKHIETCVICSGALCNAQEIRVNMTRRCEVCNDRRSCMFFDPKREMRLCNGTKYYFQSETCFYGREEKSGNITRGCTLLAFPGRQRAPPRNLHYCAKNGCNSPSVNDFKCYQCDSNAPNAAPGYCFVIQGAKMEMVLNVSPCEGDLLFLGKQRGCYTYNTPTGILKRGCIRHLTEETIAYCGRNQTHCKLCYLEGCNNQNVSGGGGRGRGDQMVSFFWVLIFIGGLF